MVDIALKCSCGNVRGTATHITPNVGTHLVCCCDDCQAFARFLGREDEILDEYGGTEIFQLPPSQVSFSDGAEQLRCMRLTRKGVYRWYTECCKTPVGNTGPARIPFLGLIRNIMDDDTPDTHLGPIRGYLQVKHARHPPPFKNAHPGFPLSVTLRAIFKMLLWKVAGKGKPSAFFDADGKAVSKPHILESG